MTRRFSNVTGARSRLRPLARRLAAPFQEGSHPWFVVGRNMVPVIGVHLFGWSSDMVVLDYWFDGATALGALVACVVPSVMREKDSPFGHSRPGMIVGGILAWLVGTVLLGIPLIFAFLVLVTQVVDASVWSTIFSDRVTWGGFVLVAVANALDILPRGYASLPEAESRRELRWQFHLLLLRAVALLGASVFLRAGILLPFAVALSFAQIYPLRAMRFLGLPDDEDDVPVSPRSATG